MNDNLNIELQFQKNTKSSLTATGTLTIRCRKGLWAVSSRDHDAVKRDARHYFFQYWKDGEYDN